MIEEICSSTKTLKMKILLVAPYGGVPGGISRWTGHLLNYYNDLENPDCKIDLVSTGRSTFININSNPVHRFIAGIKDYRKIFYDYNQKIIRNSYDILHLTSSGSWGLIKDWLFLKIAKKRGIKTIIHFRFGRIPDLFQKKNWEYKLLINILNTANKVIVIDKRTFDSLVDHGYKNIEILSNPLSPEVEDFVNRNYQTISRDSNTVLFAGHVVRTKGVFELVEACKNIQGIRLKMIGKSLPGISEELLKLAKRDGDNSWLELCGERPYNEVLAEMMKCSIFVLPTYTEGFPNVILESMACGCSIIATDVGAIPEMLDNKGLEECGVVIAPKDVDELEDAICKLLENPQQRTVLGAKAQRRVSQVFNMRSVWNELIRIWKSI